jgi:hypothetical protein
MTGLSLDNKRPDALPSREDRFGVVGKKPRTPRGNLMRCPNEPSVTS